MGIVISLDTGAVFTDIVVDDGKRMVWTKALTTHRNPKICFMNCIKDVGRQLELTPNDIMAQASFIRWSFSLAHELIMRKDRGSVGVIVTKGMEDEILLTEYLSEMIPGEMIIEIEGKAQETGSMAEDVRNEEISETIRHLVDLGALDIVVYLSHPSYDYSHEKKIREIANLEYPAHYLGSPGIFLGSETTMSVDDSLIRNATILNAFLHRDVERYASAAEDTVRDIGYKHPLFVGQGTAQVSKFHQASAVSVCNSSAAAAANGCAAFVKKKYGINDFVCLEVGGGSMAYVTTICRGEVPIIENPVISKVPIGIPMIGVSIVPGASGSNAWVRSDRSQIDIVPRGATAFFQAAAYDRKYSDPTVMDAQIVLGFLDPDNFLDANIRLRKDWAVKAVKDKIADKIGKSVEETAYDIIKKAEQSISQAIQQELQRKKMRPSDVTLIAFGGAGGSLCCGCASYLGIDRIIVFRFNAVAGALFSLMGDTLDEGYRQVELSESLPFEMQKDNDSNALKGRRPVFWGQGFQETDVYRLKSLKPGSVVLGPSIIETMDTTYIMPAGWRFTTDKYLNGIMEVKK